MTETVMGVAKSPQMLNRIKAILAKGGNWDKKILMFLTAHEVGWAPPPWMQIEEETANDRKETRK